MRCRHVPSCLLLALGQATASTASASDNGPLAAVPAVWNGFGYLFNITVGPSPLTVLSDWTWASLFVRSGRCQNRYDPRHCVGAGQDWFNETQSPTFENSSLPQTCWSTTAFSDNFTVDYARDEVCVREICHHSTLQLSDLPYRGADIPAVPFAGIYGMAPVTPGLGPESHPAAYQSWKAGKLGPRLGWHSCATLASTESCLGGDVKMVFGGTDGSLYRQSELQEFKIRNPPWLEEAFYPSSQPRTNYWSTGLTGSWMRFPGGQASPNFAIVPADFEDSNRTLGLLDEGSEGLAAPLSLRAYRFLASQVNATLASSDIVREIVTQGSSGFNVNFQDWYTVPCDGENFPDLVYELEHRANYTIGPEDYVIKLRERPEKPVCYLGINVWRFGRMENGDARVLLLGGAFMKRLYVTLDFERLSFSLAPLLGSSRG